MHVYLICCRYVYNLHSKILGMHRHAFCARLLDCLASWHFCGAGERPWSSLVSRRWRRTAAPGPLRHVWLSNGTLQMAKQKRRVRVLTKTFQVSFGFDANINNQRDGFFHADQAMFEGILDPSPSAARDSGPHNLLVTLVNEVPTVCWYAPRTTPLRSGAC